MINWTEMAALFERIDEAHQELGFDTAENCLYRGHPSVEYSLLPSLFRMPLSSGSDYDRLESDLYFEFVTRSQEAQGLNSWDALFLMRHHGVPTRLLDWTEVLGVALYFALLGHDGTTQPCIWLLNPWALNEQSWDLRDLVLPAYLGWDPDEGEEYDYADLLALWDELPWELPVAIYPQHRNRRLAAQRGLFTIHGTRCAPLEALAPTCVKRVDIPKKAIPAIRELFTIMGTDDYLLFPDSDGLARALNSKYALSGMPGDRVSGQRVRYDEPKRDPNTRMTLASTSRTKKRPRSRAKRNQSSVQPSSPKK